jgi:putative restriction endonuclease
MDFWWVTQNKTYKQEIKGFLWSPKRNSNGAYNQSYENMKSVKPGDVVFSFKDSFIKAVGIAISEVQPCPKPDFDGEGTSWSDDGWLVEVDFTELNHPVRPKDFIELLRPHLPDKYSPLQRDGRGQQGVYLAAASVGLATALAQLIGDEFEQIVSGLKPDNEGESALDDLDAALRMRTDISATEVYQLSKARRGQGLFKSNVRIVESTCRVTGVEQVHMLRASHIKPWKDSTDSEKIDGFNGLLLSPHIDHLFDKGYISFEKRGGIILSPQLEKVVLSKWRIDPTSNVGTFSSDQANYLEYHQEHVFRAVG